LSFGRVTIINGFSVFFFPRVAGVFDDVCVVGINLPDKAQCLVLQHQPAQHLGSGLKPGASNPEIRTRSSNPNRNSPANWSSEKTLLAACPPIIRKKIHSRHNPTLSH